MSILPDIFVDPALRSRQDQLNAQWISLNTTINHCDSFPDAEWVQFANDFTAWQAFYASESDWTTASKHATDDWQTKLQTYAQDAAQYCGDTGADAVLTGSYTPTVKDPPPDPVDTSTSFLDELKADIAAPFVWIEGVALKVGIGIAVVVGLILIAIVVIAIKGKVKAGPGGVAVG